MPGYDVFHPKNIANQNDGRIELLVWPSILNRVRRVHDKSAETRKRLANRIAAGIRVVRQTEVSMLVTLVAILRNGQLCLEKVVTNNEQSGITMAACQVNGQIGIADWLANGQYHEWKLKG